MAYYDISHGLKEVLGMNGVRARIIEERDGSLTLQTSTWYGARNSYPLTKSQADILSRWLDMGTGSTNEKAYNTIRGIMKEEAVSLPATLTQAHNAGGPVNMGQWGQRMTPERAGIAPAQRYGALYSYREMNPRPSRGRYGQWYNPFAPLFHRHGFAPTYEGERIAPGTMPTYSRREDGRMLPTTGAFPALENGQRQAEANNDLLDDIQLNARIEKPSEAVYPKGKGIPYSKAITADVYFTTEKFKEVMRSHGIEIGTFPVPGKDGKEVMMQGVMVHNSASRKDNLFYSMTDAEMAALLNPSLEKASGGVTLQERLDIINSREEIRHDFSGPITKEMLEGSEIIHIPLTAEGRTEIEKDFLAYDEMQARQKMMTEAAQQARSEYLSEEGRIRRDPNAISGRDIAAVMGSCGWFSGTAHGREIVVGEIRVDDYYQSMRQNIKSLREEIEHLEKDIKDPAKAADQERLQGRLDGCRQELSLLEKEEKDFSKDNAKGRFVMSAVINGKTQYISISKSEYDKFLRYDDEHRLRLFDKLFDEVSIGQVDPDIHDGQSKPYDVFLTADGREVVTREQLEIDRALSRDVDGGLLKDLNHRKGFYMEGRHGREVNVENIRVEQDLQQEGKYKMTAVIDGKAVTHEINQKQYDKFMACDDYQRFKLFSKVFPEVDMKTRPEHRTNIGAMILAGMVAVTDGARMLAGIAGGHGPGMPPPPLAMPMHPESVHFMPSVYEERHAGPAPHTRAADLAAAIYETENSQQQGQGQEQSVGQGRSMGT